MNKLNKMPETMLSGFMKSSQERFKQPVWRPLEGLSNSASWLLTRTSLPFRTVVNTIKAKPSVSATNPFSALLSKYRRGSEMTGYELSNFDEAKKLRTAQNRFNRQIRHGIDPKTSPRVDTLRYDKLSGAPIATTNLKPPTQRFSDRDKAVLDKMNKLAPHIQNVSTEETGKGVPFITDKVEDKSKMQALFNWLQDPKNMPIIGGTAIGLPIMYWLYKKLFGDDKK